MQHDTLTPTTPTHKHDDAEASDILDISQKWDSNIPKAKRFARK
jgi:hypothetical protein